MMREALAVARLDLGEVRRSRWVQLGAAVYAALALVFVLAGARESSVLPFASMSRVLRSLGQALVVIAPLVTVGATCQVVNRAREDGTLEVLFAQPLSRAGYLVGVTVTRYAVLALPALAMIAVLGLVGGAVVEGADAWRFAARAGAVTAALIWAFTGLGLAVSVFTRNVARAMVHGLILWALGVALVDFALVGAMLQWSLNPRVVFLLAALNPVQAARLALLAGLATDLETLGPVGLFLATRVGSGTLLALGIAWPTLVGSLAWAAALGRFRRGDAV